MVSESIVFQVQAVFSFTTMMFCIGMLASNKDPTYYLPVLTSIIGYWLPSPRQRKGGATRKKKLLASSSSPSSPDPPSPDPAPSHVVLEVA